MVGLVSNTDGRADALLAAVDVFLAGEAEFIIHCGDVGGRHVLDALARVGGGFAWGDRDRDRMGLMRHAQRIGLTCFGAFGEFEYEEKRIAVLHGEDRRLMEMVLSEQRYDYVLCGHVMVAEDRMVGRTRVLNPGPLHGGAARSAAMFDPIEGHLKLIPL
jgi:predicted phosphodiesterase